MDDKLLSTREAAALLGVGTTSVKRWADEGLLACVKTAGGHRRYERSAVLALIGRPPVSDEAPVVAPEGDWVDLLIHGQGTADIVAALERERATHGSWWRVADGLGAVIVDLGRRWETGQISVLQEHLASARLLRALTLCSESIRVPAGAPRALLLTAASDDHTIGLVLVELVLREAGWAGRWVGRRAPIDQVVHFVEQGHVELVAVSASSYSTDQMSLATQAERLAAACAPRGVTLLLGGLGAWPDPPPYGARLRTFAQLRGLLAELEPGPAAAR